MPRKTYSQLASLLIGSLLLLTGCESQPQLVEQRILQFGTVIDISLIHSDVEKAEAALKMVEQQLQDYRDYWHAWEDSDLYRFNQALARAESVPIPKSLQTLIGLSQDYYQSSNKLFNPALGMLIDAYGFHGNEQADDRLIAKIQGDLPLMSDLIIRQNQATSLNPYLQLDFGGIAKGYAMSLIADLLTEQGFEHFLINAGGDLIVSGNRFNKPWRLGIQNPFKSGAIASIQLKNRQHLFTSGNYQRFYQQDGKIVHHIIDPRTGKPANRITSATVLTDNAVLADVAATSFMIDGWDNHKALSDSLGVSDYLIVNDDREIIISRSFYEKIEFTIELPHSIVD